MVRGGTLVTIDVTGARGAAAAMLGAALVLPLTGHGGLPCPLRTLTGIPCPICGMTTSVEASVHAHPLAAFGANPAGPLLTVLAAVLVVRPPTRTFALPAAAVVVVAVALWLFELHRFSLI